MKQIVVLSGKGGTGKTVISGALAKLSENKVMADCDVDAADLHLLLNPDIKERHEFRSGATASIDKEKCIEGRQCIDLCRFEAINENFEVDPVSCEGCGFCKLACPAGAIEMKENKSGEWFVSETRFGPFVHAKLGIAEENSGKLVALVRQKAKEIAEQRGKEWVIVDGSPGIGCPVIASLTGIDCALVVTEPTLSGLHDADRVMKVAKHFGVPVMVVVNKFDLNLEMTDQIEKYCADYSIDLIGKIKFDKSVVQSMVEGKTLMEGSASQASEEVARIWESLQRKVAAPAK